MEVTVLQEGLVVEITAWGFGSCGECEGRNLIANDAKIGSRKFVWQTHGSGCYICQCFIDIVMVIQQGFSDHMLKFNMGRQFQSDVDLM